MCWNHRQNLPAGENCFCGWRCPRSNAGSRWRWGRSSRATATTAGRAAATATTAAAAASGTHSSGVADDAARLAAGLGVGVQRDARAGEALIFHHHVPAIEHHERLRAAEVLGVGLNRDRARLAGQQRDEVLAVINRKHARFVVRAAQLDVRHDGDDLGGIGERHVEQAFAVGVVARDFCVELCGGDFVERSVVNRVGRERAPVKVVRDEFARRVAQLQFHKMHGATNPPGIQSRRRRSRRWRAR